MEKVRKWIPIFLILTFMTTFYLSGAMNYLTLENLKEHRLALREFVFTHWLMAPMIFISIYVISTSLSLPLGTLLSLAGGFLFQFPLSTLYVLIGATLGASIIFLSARTAFGDLLRRKAGSRIHKIEAGFQSNGTSYLLFLRFVPLFPFWLVNIVPAFFGISLSTFIWTTFIGITPGALVYTHVGAALGTILDSGESFSIHTVLNWQVKLAFILLGMFSLMPILIQKLWKKHA